MPRVPISDFLALPHPLLDVRAPVEYAQGHMPGALSLPLFSDEERAAIGTAYKQVNQETAVELGLEFFGPRMAATVRRARELAPGREVRLHCWRGGMRSGAMQWLLELAGFRVYLLEGGYKAYRRAVLADLEAPRPWRVLAGFTGSGKTEVLHALAGPAHRQAVLDLEGLAHHKGSSFGSIGQAPQPTQEQFENNLGAALAALPAATPIWVEDESRRIGRLTLPAALYAQLQAAPRWELRVPRAVRVAKLAAEYGAEDPAALTAAVERLRKRLGGLATQQAVAAIAEKNFGRMVELVLDYYDKTYAYTMQQTTATELHSVATDSADGAANAAALLALVAARAIT